MKQAMISVYNIAWLSFLLGYSAVMNANAVLLDNVPSVLEVEKLVTQAEQKRSEEPKRSISAVSSKMIFFNYSNKNIKDLLNEFAEEMRFNVLYPETETITAQVTFNAGRKITMSEAWDFVVMILEQAGYCLVSKSPNTYNLLANTKAASEPLPLYIGVDYRQLPDNMERIRYMYYFTNVQLAKQQLELKTILNSLLGVAAQDATTVNYDLTMNAIILTTRADLIKMAMELLTVFDEAGFGQTVDLLKLQHANAKDIVELFSSIIGGTPSSSDPTKKKSVAYISQSATPRARYFSDAVRVMNLDPDNSRSLNSILILGKKSDVEEVSKFIRKYLDIAQDLGKTFFHVVDLQWLQASDFEKVLKELIKTGSAAAGGTGQSTGTLASDLAFDPNMQIVAETIVEGSSAGVAGSQQQQPVQGSGASVTGTTVQRGANKLIIACTDRDWERVKALIERLDIPQKQVVIEALVMDLNSSFTRSLGAQLRTQGIVPSIFPKNMQAQAAMLTNHILGNVTATTCNGTPTPVAANPDLYNLAGDLSDILNPEGVYSVPSSQVTSAMLTAPNSPCITSSTGGQPGAVGLNSSTAFLIGGSKAVTNGAWGFFQMLSTTSTAKVFTRPVIMALNNQSVTVKSAIQKMLIGPVSAGTNPTINFVPDTATITIDIKPLISQNDTINLKITMDLTSYVQPNDANSGTKTVRKLHTNVSMKSGDVLVLGGLLQQQSTNSKNSVPFLERIPVIGNFFSARNKQSATTQLFIVIRPTVVYPRSEGGMNMITKAAATFMRDQLADNEDNCMSSKDPITHWFFKDQQGLSSAEDFQERLNDLPLANYGQDDIELANPQTWDQLTAQKGGSIRLGWLSDAKTADSIASPLEVDRNDESAELSLLLKNVANPFDMRTNL